MAASLLLAAAACSGTQSGPRGAPAAALRCELAGPPRLVKSTMALHGERALLAFGSRVVVAGTAAPNETLTAVELAPDGSPLRTATVPTPAGVSVAQVVFPVLARDGALGVEVDREGLGDDAYAIQCGALRSVVFEREWAVAHLDATFHCVSLPAAPGVSLGLRAHTAPVQGGGIDQIDLVAARLGAAAGENAQGSPTGWALATRVPPPESWGYDELLTVGGALALQVDALAVPGHGYAVALRQQGRLYLGWLDDALHAATPLAPIEGTRGRTSGPALAWNGRELLVLFSDAAGDAAAAREVRETLYALRVAPGQPPRGTPARLALGDAPSAAMRGPDTSQIAPAAVGLADGSWVVAWSVGGDPRAGGGLFRGSLARRFAPDLSAGADPPVAVAGPSAFEPQLAVAGDRVYVAAGNLDDAHGARVMASVLRCPAER